MEIFISYRRADSQEFTERLYKKLVAAFGGKSVFRDVNDILPGRDFHFALQSITTNCNVMLVIIGTEWVRIMQERSANPEDWTRFEVEAGLNRNDILVLPVLVKGAPMPQKKELPAVLRDLPKHNAVSVNDGESFDRDVEKLIKTINDVGYKRIPGTVSATIYLHEDSDRDSKIKTRVSKDTEVLLLEYNRDGTWAHLWTKDNVDGWAATEDFTLITEGTARGVKKISVNKGFGAKLDYGQLYFTSPLKREKPDAASQEYNNVLSDIEEEIGNDKFEQLLLEHPNALSLFSTLADMLNPELAERVKSIAAGMDETTPLIQPDEEPSIQLGIDVQLADAITRSKSTVDIATFEFNNKMLTEAVLEVKERGVQVRVVTDKENGLEREGGTLGQFIKAGIPITARESTNGLMHNKFMILDGKTVWTGSWNYTEKSTYQHNENSIAFDAPEIAALYKTKFKEMFTEKKFGSKASKENFHKVSVAGIPIEICFTPDLTIETHIRDLILSAQKSIHFMMFSFTNNILGNAMRECHAKGIQVLGVQEKIGANAPVGEFPKLLEAGVQVRYDGSPYFLHHKVIIIDEKISITGSMNLTNNALQVNDENVIIVHDPLLAKEYREEFDRQWSLASPP